MLPAIPELYYSTLRLHQRVLSVATGLRIGPWSRGSVALPHGGAARQDATEPTLAQDRSTYLAAIGSAIAVLIVLGSLAAAVWAPVELGVQARNGVVTWVAPDGPGWNAGISAGDSLDQARHGVANLGTTATSAYLLVAGLGVVILLFGALVLLRAHGGQARWAFWAMCLTSGVSMGTFPATLHGTWWAIALGAVALRLFGPVFIALTWTFPIVSPRPPARTLVWGPILALLFVYPLCWLWPQAIFGAFALAAHLALAVYLLVGCGRLVVVAFRPLPADARAQLQLMAIGLVAGPGPFIVLTLLPLVLTGKELVPSQLSLLALVLLPMSIGAAIIRTEFMGMTSLFHRRTLRIAIGLLLLACLATIAGLLADETSTHWGWSDALSAAAVGLAAMVVYPPLRMGLSRSAERVALRDSYVLEDTLLRLSVDLAQASFEELGPLVVSRLSSILDLSFALLTTPEGSWYHVHPRSTVPPALQAAVAERAGVQLALQQPARLSIEQIRRVPVLWLPVHERSQALGLLCLGPKRSGDRYTMQDQGMLQTLVRHLAVLISNHHLRVQLDEQIVTLRTLGARVRSAADHERQRLAGVLHDDAIQVAGEIARSLSDVLVEPAVQRNGELEGRLSTMTQLSTLLIQQLRGVATELQPPILLMGLPSALEAMLHEAEQRSGCNCPLEIDPPAEHWADDPASTALLFNIAREAVGNAIRHGGASTVRVTLTRAGDLQLVIDDDGKGFTIQSVGAIVAGGHFGLVMMQERARELGGALEITSTPGHGTTIAVRVPRARLLQEEHDR